MSIHLESSLKPNAPDRSDGDRHDAIRWSALLDAIPEPAAVVDGQGRVAHVNRAWRSWAPAGRPGLPALPVGEDFVAACRRPTRAWPHVLATVAAAVERMREGSDVSFEGRIAAREGFGGEPPLSVRIERIARSGDALLLTLAEDLTRPADARRLEQAEDGYRELYEDSPIGLFSCRPDGRYLSANPAFLRMLGYDSEAELRTLAPPLSHGSDSRPLFHFDGTGRTSAETADRELELERSDGSTVVLRLWLRPVLRPDGDLERIEGAAEDISERRVLEGKLLEAQKLEAIGQLAGGVAHDFNNVLTVILAEAQLATQAMELGRDPREHLEDIETAARGGSLVTRQLLMFARRDRNEPVSVELGRAIMGVQRMIARLIGEKVSVSLDLEPEALHVLLDPGRLDQALVNLAVNARDAMPEGGTLHFRTRRLGGLEPRAEVVVSDSGQGMSDEVRKRAMEPFFTTKARGEGTGLGLAAVYGMVKEADGHVEIESREGHGTSVRLFLPLHHPDGPDVPDRRSSPEFQGHTVVLLVEDADDVRTSTGRLLEGAGMTVLQARSGAEALALLERSHQAVDLLIADIGLPDMTGPRLAERVREALPGLPTVLMSGHPEARLAAVAGRESEVQLRKPFAFEDLAHAVVTALSITSTAP